MTTFGAFGKTPGLGDFLQFGLAPAFVGTWDRWLQGCIVSARAALGDAWQPRYLSAPIWRFALSAGLAGPEGAFGVLMPSVDRVGRLFPLTIAAAFPAGRSALQLHLSGDALYAALETVALATLATPTTVERLRQDLAPLRAPHIAAPARIDERGGRLTVAAQHGNLAVFLAAQRAATGYRSPSVWSSESDGAVRLMLTEGLPDADEMLGLFDLGAPVWSGVAC